MNKKNFAIKTFIILSLLVFGGFFEFISCLLSILFSFYLLLEHKKENKMSSLNLNFTIVMIFTIFFGYLIATIFAVDWGANLLGIAKCFPIIPFSIIVSTMDNVQKKDILGTISNFSVLMTSISVVFVYLTSSKTIFNIDGRLSGSFQYPNTFALLLLISIIIIVDKFNEDISKKTQIINFIKISILVYGIFASGSRTYLVMLGLYFVSLLFLKRNRKIAIVLVLLFIVSLICVIIYICINGYSSLGRFLSFSLTSSSFIGRIIYYIDAVPEILTHPLGLGYKGYFFSQATFKTAYYSVSVVHNEFLQMFLDAGWLSGLSLIAITLKAIFSKRSSLLFKQIAAFIALGSCLDFHFSYISIFLIFILVLDYSGIKSDDEKTSHKLKAFLSFEKNIKIKTWAKSIICIFVILINLYIFLITATASTREYSHLSLQLYPFNTICKIDQLDKCETIEEANLIADDILKMNTMVSEAYAVKSEYAYSLNDLESAIKYKIKELELSKYEIDVYTQLLDLLVEAVDYFTQADELEKVEYYRNNILQIPNIIEENINEVSPFSKYIDKQVELELPEYYENIISELDQLSQS